MKMEFITDCPAACGGEFKIEKALLSLGERVLKALPLAAANETGFAKTAKFQGIAIQRKIDVGIMPTTDTPGVEPNITLFEEGYDVTFYFRVLSTRFQADNYRYRIIPSVYLVYLLDKNTFNITDISAMELFFNALNNTLTNGADSILSGETDVYAIWNRETSGQDFPDYNERALGSLNFETSI